MKRGYFIRRSFSKESGWFVGDVVTLSPDCVRATLDVSPGWTRVPAFVFKLLRPLMPKVLGTFRSY